MERSLTYQLPWLNAMLLDPLTGGVGYGMNWQIQMFQNSLLEVFSNA
jgi:hypothetical protein